jgi:hypothetical protein
MMTYDTRSGRFGLGLLSRYTWVWKVAGVVFGFLGVIHTLGAQEIHSITITDFENTNTFCTNHAPSVGSGGVVDFDDGSQDYCSSQVEDVRCDDKTTFNAQGEAIKFEYLLTGWGCADGNCVLENNPHANWPENVLPTSVVSGDFDPSSPGDEVLALTMGTACGLHIGSNLDESNWESIGAFNQDDCNESQGLIVVGNFGSSPGDDIMYLNLDDLVDDGSKNVEVEHCQFLYRPDTTWLSTGCPSFIFNQLPRWRGTPMVAAELTGSCISGGKKVESGLDDNNDGELDAGEVDMTSYVCDVAGKDGLVKVTAESAGSNCSSGGKKVESGLDDNNDGALDAGEVDSDMTSYVCDGDEAGLVKVTTEHDELIWGADDELFARRSTGAEAPSFGAAQQLTDPTNLKLCGLGTGYPPQEMVCLRSNWDSINPDDCVSGDSWGITALVAEDFTGDGLVDLIYGSISEVGLKMLIHPSLPPEDPPDWTTTASLANRYSDAPVALEYPDGGAAFLQAGDYDGDGDLDILVGADTSLSLDGGTGRGCRILGAPASRFLFNNGYGNFSLGSDASPGQDAGDLDWLVTGDFEGDGQQDLGAGDPTANQGSVATYIGRAYSNRIFPALGDSNDLEPDTFIVRAGFTKLVGGFPKPKRNAEDTAYLRPLEFENGQARMYITNSPSVDWTEFPDHWSPIDFDLTVPVVYLTYTTFPSPGRDLSIKIEVEDTELGRVTLGTTAPEADPSTAHLDAKLLVTTATKHKYGRGGISLAVVGTQTVILGTNVELPGHAGEFIIRDTSTCASEPCVNGTCFPRSDHTYYCQCESGYTGYDCECKNDSSGPDCVTEDPPSPEDVPPSAETIVTKLADEIRERTIYFNDPLPFYNGEALNNVSLTRQQMAYSGSNYYGVTGHEFNAQWCLDPSYLPSAERDPLEETCTSILTETDNVGFFWQRYTQLGARELVLSYTLGNHHADPPDGPHDISDRSDFFSPGFSPPAFSGGLSGDVDYLDAFPVTGSNYSDAANTDPGSVTIGSTGPVVYIGANDGFLHAFDLITEVDLETNDHTVTDATEKWAYAPANSVGRIRNQYAFSGAYDPDLPTWSLYRYKRFIDGPVMVGDAYRSSDPPAPTDTWRRVVIAGQGDGQSLATGPDPAFRRNFYFALDVTNPDDPQPLWEFSDPMVMPPAPICPNGMTICYYPALGCSDSSDCQGNADDAATSPTDALGEARSKPVIARIKTTAAGDLKWVAIMASGRNNTNFKSAGRSVYVLDLFTGAVLKKWTLGGLTYVDGVAPSGYVQGGVAVADISPPGDTNCDNDEVVPEVSDDRNGCYGAIDLAYVGDSQGKLWRIDLRQGYEDDAAIPVNIFHAKTENAPAEPIGHTPAIAIHEGWPMVLFGTGGTQEADITGTYHFYAVSDAPADMQEEPPQTLVDYTALTGNAPRERGDILALVNDKAPPPGEWFVVAEAGTRNDEAGGPVDNHRFSADPVVATNSIVYFSSAQGNLDEMDTCLRNLGNSNLYGYAVTGFTDLKDITYQPGEVIPTFTQPATDPISNFLGGPSVGRIQQGVILKPPPGVVISEVPRRLTSAEQAQAVAASDIFYQTASSGTAADNSNPAVKRIRQAHLSRAPILLDFKVSRWREIAL